MNMQAPKLIFLAAFALRAGLVILLPDLIPESADKLGRYDLIALSLKDGRGFSIAGAPTAVAAPLYPGLLAVLYKLFGYGGHSKTILRLSLSLLDAGHCLLFYLIARRYFGGQVPLWTALALVLCPYFIVPIYWGITEPLFVFLQALFLLSLCRALQQKTALAFLGSGAWLGLTTLCRATTLLLPVFVLPLFAVGHWSGQKQKLGYLALFLVGFAIVIAPWLVRNYIVFDRFIPVQENSGKRFYESSLRKVDKDEYEQERARLAAASGLIEKDDFYFQIALTKIVENPQAYLRLLGRKLLRMWYRTSSKRYDGFLMFVNGALLALASIGIGMTWRRRIELLPLWVVLFYFIAFHDVLGAAFRYMLPTIPILILFAMVPIDASMRRRRTG